MLTNLKEYINYILFTLKMRFKVIFTPTQYINSQVGSYQIGDKVRLIKFLNHKYGQVEYLVKNQNGRYDCICPVFMSRERSVK